VRCDDVTVELLQPMEAYFSFMANATATGLGPLVTPPATNATINREGMEVYIDLTDLIDVAVEIARNEKEEERLRNQITGKEKKLSNERFVDRAPAEVVQRERASLAELQEQLVTVEKALVSLRSMK